MVRLEVEPYKGLVDGLINEILVAKKEFESKYDGKSVFKETRWHSHMEGLFVDQLEKLTRKVSSGEVPAEAIGEYVTAFFTAQLDDGDFDL